MFLQNIELNTDSNIVTKFKDEPNIFKIRKIHLMIGIFHFSISEAAISAGIKNMNMNRCSGWIYYWSFALQYIH